MRTGRPPKPTSVKRMLGTLKPSRANPNEAQLPPALPAPPGWLDKTLHQRFHEVARELYEAGLVSGLDYTPVAVFVQAEEMLQLCDHHWRRMRHMGMAMDGLMIKTGGRPNDEISMKRNPLLQERRDAVRELHNACVELGMTPSSRQRINAHPPAADDDPLAEFFEDRPRPRLVADNGQ
jgi:P27 family predicted phage terminase small subunit